MRERVVVASTGGWNSPSTRARLGGLAREGPWPVRVLSARSLPAPAQIEEIMAAGGEETTLILQRVIPTGVDLHRLRGRYDRIVFDLDDAIYAVPPDLAGPSPVRVAKQVARTATRGYPRASVRRKPLIRALRAVDVCVVGNRILAAFARRHCSRVVEIPTTVTPIEEIPRRARSSSLIWVGVADNLQYLKLIAGPLSRVRREIAFRFTVVSSRPWADPSIPTEFVRWSEAAERAALLEASVGIAPLTDDPWTRGKCALRAILYGGHALPTVASPVGITDEVIVDGETGLLAQRTDQWIKALRALLDDPVRATTMGQNALQRIRNAYSEEIALGLWRELLRRDAGSPNHPRHSFVAHQPD